MYEYIKSVSLGDIAFLKELLKSATWDIVKGSGRDYMTWFPDKISSFGLGEIDQAFFLKIPPGGKVHKHVDTPRVAKTYHLPITTNDDCISYVLDVPHHLEVGKIYNINRQLEHHSVNNGPTDRIHLILECISAN